MNPEIIHSNPIFDDVPEAQIEWMISKGEIKTYQPGEFIFRRGEAADHLLIIESGEFQVYFDQDGERRYAGDLVAGDVTGVLPYSRMKQAGGFGEAKVESVVFTLHRDHFQEMIHDHYELTSTFVHHMTNRVRTFAQIQLQNEKLMALGKLSAGLAHELNNPASAIVRSAQALQKHLQLVPDNFKKVLKMKATDEDIDVLNGLLFDKLSSKDLPRLSLMEKTELEDELADWLEDNGVEDGYDMTDNLVEFRFTEEDLELVLETVGADFLGPVVKWLDSNVGTERMVGEIEEAASRIAELVQSVKGYTHMDQANDMQKVDLHIGLDNTLTMLKHKVKQNKVEIVQEYAEKLNPVMGFPGELNQIFTNLIDNALDAMEEKGGQLKIKTWNDGKFVRLDIQDSGSGIPEDKLRKIFEPFYTTKEMGKGTGMGLDVVSKIVNKHKGVINVQSKPGKTVFELCFSASV